MVLEVVPGAYIVEFNDDADLDQFSRQAEPRYTTRMALDYKLFRGVSIQLSNTTYTGEDYAGQLASLDAVKNIWPVKKISQPASVGKKEGQEERPSSKRDQLHATRQESNETLPYAPHVMTGIDRLHAEGITGDGVTIAIIDAGIDYTHPALGGCFGEGCVVTHGYDFVELSEDPSDLCSDAGTHSAGIIAALGDSPNGLTGAAPGASLASYRVFDCWGSTSTDILIAAFNRAYEEGADIITGSIISYNGWPDEPFSLSVSRIVEKGVPCILPAGNGLLSIFDSSSPADGKGVTSVGSFDSGVVIGTWLGATYTVDGGESISFPWTWGLPYANDGYEREVFAISLDVNSNDDACSPLSDDIPYLGEYYVLFRESTECDSYTQTTNLVNHGAFFMIRYGAAGNTLDSYNGPVGTGAANSVFHGTAVAWIEAIKAGSTIRAAIDRFEYAPSIEFQFENKVNPGAASSFSSWGPTFNLDFKPQFGAPGRHIFSLALPEYDEYLVESSTSSAAALVAAAYALVSEARGTKDPGILESLFASTANPQLFSWDLPFEGYLAPAAQQGAGMIQAYDAAFTKARLEPSSLSFKDTGSSTLSFTIVNDGDDATYSVSYVPSRTFYVLEEDETTVISKPGERTSETAGLAFSETEIAIGARSNATIEVTVSPPDGLNEKRYPYWSGFITVNGTDGSSISIPYQGISGSLSEANVLPHMHVYDYADWYLSPIPEGTLFLLPAPGQEPDWSSGYVSIPAITWDLPWGARKVTVEATNLGNCTSYGNIFQFPAEFLPRANGYTANWLGQLASGEYVPVGTYRLTIRVQHLMSNGSETEDWVSLRSTPFEIAYEDPRAE
ncbi:peptidase S8/S53 domain-containing protein [Stachybotrys elegans]|uniref:Peptidase S8/S53 domain-containing protein n=1 Tax=Stachybotrys elegans TaxID=80388 RepID=A0A8K0WK91_9HYPO|nr:peptidase S8/S53 domain-containing protein [Stachybotrys elegans]